MTTEEYKIEVDKIKEQFIAISTELAKKYAHSNNPYKIGDVITDHCGSIKIDEIDVAFGFQNSIPECVYKGVELKKDGTPKKGSPRTSVWQQNIVK